MTTTSDNIAVISKALEGVTPGPWETRQMGKRLSKELDRLMIVGPSEVVHDGDGICEPDRMNDRTFGEDNSNMLYIAACSPERISALLAEARKAEAMKQALKTPFCVLYLDGRNEHGTHVLPSYPRSFEVVDEDVAEQAEAILEAAENAGFQIGQHVWAEFACIAPQIGDEGRVELDGYWDFRWINEPMSTLLNGGSDAQG